MYSLRLLGVISLEGPSGPVSGRVTQRRRLALLALLGAAGDRGWTRDRLVGLLWPEASDGQARHLLSDSLYVIRQALDGDGVSASGDVLRLNAEAVWTDAVAFERAIKEGQLQEAVELYRGPFLDGFHVGDALELERWVETERSRLAGLYSTALETLAQQAEDAGEHATAVEWWRRLAAHDPYNSRRALRLMQALMKAGNPAGALEHARVHELLVKEELGVEPSDELMQVVERLKREPRPVGDDPASGLPSTVHEVDVGTDAPSEAAATRLLIRGIHRRLLWQVLLIYVVGAWACYELIERITDRLALPAWLPVLAVILLLLGLVFNVATALVQERGPAGGQADRASIEDSSERLAAGSEISGAERLFTWRNAITGGVVALALWGVVAAGWLVFGEGRASSAAERKSIAVLPFENLSPNPDDAYLADAMHDEIISQLGKIASLKVISRTSVMEYRDQTRNLREIAQELGVTHILEGTVRREDDRVRITTQLIDAAYDEHIWVEHYERDLPNTFSVQAELAQTVASVLEEALTPEELERIQAKPTDSPQAYDQYIRGSEYLNRSWQKSNLRIAGDRFSEAVRLDPEFAAAYARLSVAHSRMYWFGYDRTEGRLGKAREAAEKAFRLKSDLPDAHIALGTFYYYAERDYERALAEFSLALRLQPNNSDALFIAGAVHARRGEWTLNLKNLKKAFELDPRSPVKATLVAQSYGWLRNFSEALRHIDMAISLSPETTQYYFIKAFLILSWRGDPEEALRVIEEAPAMNLSDLGAGAARNRWRYYFMAGKYERPLQQLNLRTFRR